MANVIVLSGGGSDERDVSLRSGLAVAAALIKSGHQVTQLDPRQGLDQLLPQLQACDVVFPALHGFGGEDGSLQSFLESHNIRFVGSGSKASAVCYDKFRYFEILKQHGYLLPATELVDHHEYLGSSLAKSPYVLKPNDGGSSIDTFIVRDTSSVDTEAIRQSFDRHTKMLLQQLIEGDEITVAVLGGESLPVIEIIPPENQEFDYDNKYNGATQEICPPTNISLSVQDEAREQALQIHRLTGCSAMSRTDFMVDQGSRLFVLETNTIPGLTDQSLLPKAAAVAGYDMAEVCNKLVALAQKD